MPIELKYVNDVAGVEFVCTGRVTGAEIIEANNSVYRHEGFVKLKYQLIDRTDCTDYQVSNAEIEQIARQDLEAAKINPNMIVVFVATTDLQYGLTRMYQAHVGNLGFETELFRDRSRAIQWLEDRPTIPGPADKPDGDPRG